MLITCLTTLWIWTNKQATKQADRFHSDLTWWGFLRPVPIISMHSSNFLSMCILLPNMAKFIFSKVNCPGLQLCTSHGPQNRMSGLFINSPLKSDPSGRFLSGICGEHQATVGCTQAIWLLPL